MKKLDFKQWLTGQYRTNFYQTFSFEGVSSYELKQLLETSSRKELGDAFFLELKEEILGRLLETNTVKVQQPQPAPMKKWIYSKVIKALGELQPDDDVGVSKAREGVWDVVHLDTGKRAFSSEAELASYVKSVRNGTAPIVAGSIEELRKVAGEFRARQAPSPRPQSAEVAPPETKAPTATTYILSTMKQAVSGFKVGDSVAVAKGEGDNWTITPLTGNHRAMSVPKADLPNFVKSVRDESDKPISSTDIEDLKKRVSGGEEKKPEPKVEKKLPSGRLPDHKMSRYNREIEEAFLGSDKNIVINALAGTGKTTMLKHLASYKKPGERWLYLVFNKKNQVEATKLNHETNERPFPPGVEVLTTHSFLGRLLDNNSRTGKFQKTELHDGKGQSPKLSEMLDDDWFKNKATQELGIPFKKVWPLKMRVKDLASKGKAFNVDPKQSNAAMRLLDELIDKYNIDTTLLSEEELEQAEKDGRDIQDYRDEVVDMTYDVLRRMVPKGSPTGSHYAGVRDHDDTLWWAALHADELQWPRFDVVLADEVQDFNKNQQVMLRKLNEAGARIIAVGDPWQAIYRFRGADNDAFSNVEKIAHGGKQGGTTHMLPINFRSGKKIIDFANSATHMKDLDEDRRLKSGMSHDGEVTTHRMYSDVMDTIHDEWDKKRELSMPTAILARNNAPLLATAMSLLKRGIPFQIIGREFLDEINKFIKKVTGIGKNATNYPIEEFREKMNEYVAKKEEEWRGKAKKQGELEELTTIGDSLNGVLSYLEQNNWYDPQDTMKRNRISDAYTFQEFLRNRFGGLNVQESDADADRFEKMKDKVVNITTGHRSKGLEFDRVYIIRNDLYDSPKGDNPEEIQQERNGQYVAYTRAKKELHVINDKEPGG